MLIIVGLALMLLLLVAHIASVYADIVKAIEDGVKGG